MDLKRDGLKVVMYASLLSESMIDIKGSSLDKGKARQYLNAIPNLLAKQIRQLDGVYAADPTLATALQNEVDKLLTKMAKSNLVELIIINQMHDKFMEDPDKWKKDFPIALTKLDSNLK